jgi:hypothetical protein
MTRYGDGAAGQWMRAAGTRLRRPVGLAAVAALALLATGCTGGGHNNAVDVGGVLGAGNGNTATVTVCAPL